MDLFSKVLSAPVIVESSDGQRILKTEDAKTIAYLDVPHQEKETASKTMIYHESVIKAFDCVLGRGDVLSVLFVDENNVFWGYDLNNNNCVKSFEPHAVSGEVISFSLLFDLNRQLNLFYAVTELEGKSKTNKLYHYKAENGILGKMPLAISSLEKGFYSLKSLRDGWNSFHLFYLSGEKGDYVLKHRCFMPFAQSWTPSVFLSLPEKGEVLSYSAALDTKNDIHLVLFQKLNQKNKLVYYKREIGGWPRKGWQKGKVIAQRESAGVPTIDLDEGFLSIIVYTDSELYCYSLQEDNLKFVEKKEVGEVKRKLFRYRTLLAGKAEYIIAGDPNASQILNKEKAKKVLLIPKSTQKKEILSADNLTLPGDNIFVRQAVKMIESKADLATDLAKKERKIFQISQQYERKINLLKDQLASRSAAIKSLEDELNKQRTRTLIQQEEEKSWQKKLQVLKTGNKNWQSKLNYALKENNELKEMLESINKKLAKIYSEHNLVKKKLAAAMRDKSVWEKLGSIFHGKE